MAHLKKALLLLLGIQSFGTIGYVVLEGWSILDALYMTIITISTTGFAEVHPLTPLGRLLTVCLIVSGVTTLAYIGGRSAQLLIESRLLRRNKVNRRLAAMTNHYIICGYGHLGRAIAEELMKQEVPFTIIEQEAAIADEIHATGNLLIHGDATHDNVLIQAGIERAKGLVAALGTDADNVYCTLSAKVLNPKLFVVTRAEEDRTEQKLLQAGADRVVKPYDIGAQRMVHLLLRPGVVDFFDKVSRKNQVDLNFEEIQIAPGSGLIGQTLANTPIRKDLNIIVIAIMNETGKFVYNPQASNQINAGDVLIAIGDPANLKQLRELSLKTA